MTYSVTKLITNAFYLSGKVARQLESVSGDDISDGLDLLNDFLGMKTSDRRMVPYYELISFPLVPGQEKYFVPNLIEISSDTFNIGPVRYPMKRVGRFDYFASARVDNINSIPFSYHMERVKGGSDIYIYFNAAQDYPLNTMGKFGLMQITDLGMNLETKFDRDYITYLRYGLAEYICAEYAISFPPEARQKLAEIEAVIMDKSPIDFTMQKSSSLTKESGLNWGDVNIGQGYRP